MIFFYSFGLGIPHLPACCDVCVSSSCCCLICHPNSCPYSISWAGCGHPVPSGDDRALPQPARQGVQDAAGQEVPSGDQDSLRAPCPKGAQNCLQTSLKCQWQPQTLQPLCLCWLRQEPLVLMSSWLRLKSRRQPSHDAILQKSKECVQNICLLVRIVLPVLVRVFKSKKYTLKSS